MNEIRLGNIYGATGGNYAGNVYDKNGIAPTINTCGGGGREPMIIESQIVAMRGRDPENPSDRTAGNPNLEQRLEPNSEGISNTITTVQKDNMVLEVGHIEKGTGKHQSNVVYSEDGLSPTICASYGVKQPPAMHVEVRQATKEGSIPCKIGGVADLNYPSSKTRRGRVQENGEICPTLTTENIPSVIEPWIWEIDGVKYLIRIRKLTPKECWRLMNFTDDDFSKAAAVNSNTQLYKQAGNSIVKNVLCEVFKQLL